MKKILTVIFTLLPLFAYADGMRANAVGAPINLQSDTYYLNFFPSRVASGSISAVWVAERGGDYLHSGLCVKGGGFKNFIYTTSASYDSMPEVLAASAVFSADPTLQTAGSLMYGAEFGNLLAGFNYSSSFLKLSESAVSTEVSGSYQIHKITPSMSYLGDALQLDIAAPLSVQSLAYSENAVSYRLPALSKYGLNLQLSYLAVEDFVFAVRFTAYASDSSVNSNSVNFESLASGAELTLGSLWSVTSNLSVFIDFAYTYFDSTVSGVLTYSKSTLPESLAGFEMKLGDFTLRAFGKMTGLSVTEVNAGNVSMTSSFNYSTGLGAGYFKMPWSINVLLDSAAIQERLVDGTGENLISLQVNYCFTL